MSLLFSLLLSFIFSFSFLFFSFDKIFFLQFGFLCVIFVLWISFIFIYIISFSFSFSFSFFTKFCCLFIEGFLLKVFCFCCFVNNFLALFFVLISFFEIFFLLTKFLTIFGLFLYSL